MFYPHLLHSGKRSDSFMSFFIGGENGFTLLEIMVSMAIMAIALVTIMQLFSGALRSAKVSHDYSLAVIAAKEKMDEALSVKTMEDFDELARSGEFGEGILEGYKWEIIGPEEYEIPMGLQKDIEESGGDIEGLSSKLYKIGIKIKWVSGANEKEVGFTTLKILEEKD